MDALLYSAVTRRTATTTTTAAAAAAAAGVPAPQTKPERPFPFIRRRRRQRIVVVVQAKDQLTTVDLFIHEYYCICLRRRHSLISNFVDGCVHGRRTCLASLMVWRYCASYKKQAS